MQKSSLVRILIGCALLWQGATDALAQSNLLHDVPANLTRWMYPFNASPGSRPTASTFAAIGSGTNFDTRDGQYLLGWNTSNTVPIGLGVKNYLIRRARVTLTISSDLFYSYRGTLRDYRTYLLTNSPDYISSSDTNCPIELFGAGFRGGVTNTNGVFAPYSALNFTQTGPFFVKSGGGDFTNRTVFAACFDTNGVLVDVSNNINDDGTNEQVTPFEVAPFAVGYATNFVNGELMPEGSQMVFDLNLDDPLIYGYLQTALNQGAVRLMVSSLVNANFFSGSANWPDFYTLFNALAETNEYPLLDLDVTSVRTNVDSDANGLPDDWEQFYFGTIGNGANSDPDGDGLSNLAEYQAGSNPAVGTSSFRLLSLQRQTNGNELRFSFAPNRQYQIRWSDDMQTWQTVTNPVLTYSSAWLAKSETNPVYPSPVYAVWRDTNALSAKRFYRVSAQ